MLSNHESMFETFLKTAHQNDKKAADERALVEAMKKLPPEVLFKIANGEEKLGSSYLKACSSGPGGCEGMEWVEQFKDTPFFEQALQLEQQSIQLEQLEQQHRAQRDAENAQAPKFWEMQDQVRLQKRLLGLQLAAMQLQQVGPGAAPMAPGPAPAPPVVAEAAGGAAPSPADGKVASDHATELGRRMALGDYERAVTTNSATELGRELAKTALDVSALAGLGQKAVGFLGKNPGAALGAAAGAAGGLAHGLQKDQQGQRHVLGGLAQGVVGGAGGALAGHAAQNIGGAMRGGASLGQAAKGYGQQLQQLGGRAATQVQGALKPATSGTAPAAAAPTKGALGATLPAGAQGRVAPTLPASANPSLMGATNQALNFQRAPTGIQAAVKSNPLVASGEIAPEAAHQLMSWSSKGGLTPQAVAQMNNKTPRPAGFVDPREAATRVGG